MGAPHAPGFSYKEATMSDNTQNSFLSTLDPQKLLEILDMLHSGISIFSKEGNFIYSNDSFDRMFGLNDKSHMGRSVLEYFFSGEAGVMEVVRHRNCSSTASLSRKNMCHGFTHRYPLIDEQGELIGCLTETLYSGRHKEKVEELKKAIMALTEKIQYYESQLNAGRLSLCTFDSIIGTSPAISHIKQLGMRYASGEQPVLITGESGTGKELVAQALHAAGGRAHNPFVTVNCAALPRELMESELFGYAPGAFSGANARGLKGKFELADKGTIFLDEIGELPLNMQAKLLRVLESGEVQKLGKAEPSHIDFRLIAATNRDLKQMVRDGHFREDLYYRLNILVLNIPPLRERTSDIPLLAQFLLANIVGTARAQRIKIGTDVLERFLLHEWPGNIRELKNVLTFASYAMEEDCGILGVQHLPPHFSPAPTSATAERAPASATNRLAEVSTAAEKKVLMDALQRANNNRSLVARQLGISRKTLYKKMHDFGLV